MLIYNYDPITFEYLSSEEAYRNPLNPDEPLIPACATTKTPIKPKKGYTRVWVGNKWENKEDHRGEVWFNINDRKLETILFIGPLEDKYCSPDEPIANPPEGDYWTFDKEKNEWVGNSVLYKKYVYSNSDIIWDLKSNTPYEFEGYYFLPSWRELYISIFTILKEGIQKEYTIRDANDNYLKVDLNKMKTILAKMASVVDEMYLDKHKLTDYFETENDFNKLQKAYDTWVQKQY